MIGRAKKDVRNSKIMRKGRTLRELVSGFNDISELEVSPEVARDYGNFRESLDKRALRRYPTIEYLQEDARNTAEYLKKVLSLSRQTYIGLSTIKSMELKPFEEKLEKYQRITGGKYA